MRHKKIPFDPRWFQLLFQLFFLLYGLVVLRWPVDWLHDFLSISGCLLFQFLLEARHQKKWPGLTGSNGFFRWGFSVLISALSLCLLLKTSSWPISLLAAFLTVGSKFLFRYRQHHLFNPSAFGIVAIIFLTNEAWLSPAQWGSGTVLFFSVVTLGTIAVTRVQKLDLSLTFLLVYAGLLYWRQVLYLHWPADHFLHSLSTGSLLLFSFFMLPDPKTSPRHPLARVLWAVAIAMVSFYLAVFRFQYNKAIVVLVLAAPLVPLLNLLLPAQEFDWGSRQRNRNLSVFSRFARHGLTRKMAAAGLLLVMFGHEAAAFCGFYVSKADGTLKNKTSQVIVVRDGEKTAITMYNDFKGNLKDFAMVVPVPVVLQKKDIRVIDLQIFQTLNEYSQPRLVEYYDQNPCNRRMYDSEMALKSAAPLNELVVSSYGKRKEEKVRIEARYLVGEYDILILSAQESSALESWLTANGYKLPPGAREVLEPYIKSNLKFFVVKVNEEEKRKLKSNFLRPIQISFRSPGFMLPIRLGMANADGDQDMLVYGFTKKGRMECTNYRTVALPTGKNIPLFVKNNFSAFYSNLFQHQWNREGKSVALLEYAWDVSPQNFSKCDPCVSTPPSQQNLVQAGVWWTNPSDKDYAGNSPVYFTRLHIRYNRVSFPQDLQFQVTPETENYQARYIVTHPATGDFSCEAGRQYISDLKERRKGELEMLHYLTGKGYKDWDLAAAGDGAVPSTVAYASLADTKAEAGQPALIAVFGASLLLLVGLYRWQTK